MKKFFWLVLGLLSLSLFFPSPTAAQDPPPGLKMDAMSAFEGYFKYGEWLPIWVHLENSGPDLEAEVRVHITGGWGAVTFAAPVPLPTGSRKRVPVYVLPNNFSRQLEVQLVDGKGNVLVTQKALVSPQVNITWMVGLVAPQRGALSLIDGASTQGIVRPKVLVDLSLTDLPERVEGLASFDCLILNDVDTSTLTPEQKTALESWVRQGGRLILGGGVRARQVAAGLPESLLPLIPRGEVEMETLPGLTTLGGDQAVRVPGPFLLAIGDAAEGRTLAEQNGLPLARERAVGDGVVDWVALDMAASPFDAWAGTIDFWTNLVLLYSSYPSNLPSDVSPRQMRADQMIYALSNLPSLALPSVRGLGILLGVYILLVGPVNYLVLRWRKKLQWAWGTIPALTLLFSGGAFGLGYALRGTDLILNKIALVAAGPDGTATLTTYLGLFSPSQQSYEIQVNGVSLLSPMNPSYDPWAGSSGNVNAGEVVFVQGDPGRVRGLTVNQWSMQTFMAETVWTDLGQVVGDLHFEGGAGFAGALVGTVRNQTSLTFKDAVVALGSDFVRLGDLAPGAEAKVRLVVAETGSGKEFWGTPLSYRLFENELSNPGPNGPPREVQLKQQILDNILNSGGKFSPISSVRPMGSGGLQGLTFLGWFDQVPPEVRVADRAMVEQTTALFYAPLDYKLPEAGPVTVPAGIVPGRIVEMPVEGGQCGMPGVTAVYIGRGEAKFEFQLPEGVRDMQVDQLTLSIRSDGGWMQLPQVALYDWSENGWSGLSEPVLGDNIIRSPASLIGEDGLVRVRLSVENNQGGGCLYVGVGFNGAR